MLEVIWAMGQGLEDGRKSTVVVASTPAHRCTSSSAGTILPKCKTNPDSTSKRLILLFHLLHILLLLLDLSVLGHILRTGEIVIVSSVNFGVKCGNKGCSNSSEVFPFDALEEWMLSHLCERRIPHASMSDEAEASPMSYKTRGIELKVPTE